MHSNLTANIERDNNLALNITSIFPIARSILFTIQANLTIQIILNKAVLCIVSAFTNEPGNVVV